MNLKTAFVGLGGATLLAATGIVATATPASALNFVHVRVDPANWTWSGTISIYHTNCRNGDNEDDSCVYVDPDATEFTTDFIEGPSTGLVEIPTGDVWWDTGSYQRDLRVTFTNNTFTSDSGVTRKGGDVQVRIVDPTFGQMYVAWQQITPGEVPVTFNFGKPGGEYELKAYPEFGAPSLQNLNASMSAAVAGGAGCTVKGTPGDDVLEGTSGDDVICGLGGNDVIRGKGGDDVIHGGGGHDTIRGGNGNDLIAGGKGRDTIHAGGKGADDISGGKGKDTIHHTKGHDWVHGGPHKDKLINVNGVRP